MTTLKELLGINESLASREETDLEFIKKCLIGQKLKNDTPTVFLPNQENTYFVTVTDVEKASSKNMYNIEVSGIKMNPGQVNPARKEPDHPYGSKRILLDIRKLLGVGTKVQWTEAGEQTKTSLSVSIKLPTRK
jgi:hypothetical protein